MMIYALTCKGPHHQENEDRVVVGAEILVEGTLECACSMGMLAVADGVGGNKSGAVASQFVADALSKATTVDSEALEQINAKLVHASLKSPALESMATTLACVCFQEHQTIIYHAGNTRVYGLLKETYLQQLTVDDTLVQQMLASGQMSTMEAVLSNQKNVITSCFGGGHTSMLNLKKTEITPHKYTDLLLTSDGIHDFLTVDEMEEALESSRSDLSRACKHIATLAQRRGSTDDQSIIIARLI